MDPDGEREAAGVGWPIVKAVVRTLRRRTPSLIKRNRAGVSRTVLTVGYGRWMRRLLFAITSAISGLAAAVTPAAGSWPGRYGPFYRTGSTQDNATTQAQLSSGEIWGKANRGSNDPSVDGWVGSLPAAKHGVEFYTDVRPSPGSPPGYARWLGPRPGVRIEGQWAKIRATITDTRFTP